MASPIEPLVIEAPEIEHAIIGAVLRFCHDPRVLDGYLSAGVRAEHFWSADYARIWRHAAALRARGIEPDPQLLHHDLGAALDGGPALLYGVVDGVAKPAPANIQEHARLLRAIWGSRQASHLATTFQGTLRQNPAAISNGAGTLFADPEQRHAGSRPGSSGRATHRARQERGPVQVLQTRIGFFPNLNP